MKECFYCHKPIYTITDEFQGDVKCPHCKVQNSFYDPEDKVESEEEDGHKT